MTNEPANQATVQALSHLGGLSYVIPEIKDRESAERIYKGLVRIARKIAQDFDFKLKANEKAEKS